MASERGAWYVAEDDLDTGIELRYPASVGPGSIATITDIEEGCFTLWSNGELSHDLLVAGIEFAIETEQRLLAERAEEEAPDA